MTGNPIEKLEDRLKISSREQDKEDIDKKWSKREQVRSKAIEAFSNSEELKAIKEYLNTTPLRDWKK